MSGSGTPSVLVAEDDPDIRMILEVALRDVGGMRVECCADGPAALAAFQRQVPDIVLLDVMMPGMDGLEVLRALRGLPGGAAVPVVFVTARVRREDLDAYRAAGATGVITKPFDAMTVAEDVRRHLPGGAETPVPANPYRPVVERFLAELPGRLERLAAAAGGLGEPWDLVSRQRLREEVHRLAGTAGSVGFEALGEAARAVEAAVLAEAPALALRGLADGLLAAGQGLAPEDSSLLRP